MNRTLIIASTLAAIAIAPAAMAQGNGNGHGKGHDKHSAGVQHGARASVAHPHGMPPGQAKKIARARGDLVNGNILPTSYPGYQTFNNYQTYNLPVAPAGYEYVRVGNDVYLRQTSSGVIANVIANLFR